MKEKFAQDHYYTINQQADIERAKYWQKYRDTITHIITKRINENQEINRNKKILIIGPGNCDDINISEIKQISKNLYCMDIDSKSVEEGLKKQACSIKGLISIDVTGFSYLGIYDNLSKLSSYREVIEFLDSRIGTMQHMPMELIKLLSSYKCFFDVIIFAPLFTQLFNLLISLIVCKFNKTKEEAICDLIKYENFVIDTINNIIEYIARPGSLIFGFTDVLELPLKSNPELSAKMYNYIRTAVSPAQVLEKYKEQQLFGYKIFTACIMKKAFNQDSYINSYLWPFCSDKWYYVLATYYKTLNPASNQNVDEDNGL